MKNVSTQDLLAALCGVGVFIAALIAILIQARRKP